MFHTPLPGGIGLYHNKQNNNADTDKDVEGLHSRAIACRSLASLAGLGFMGLGFLGWWAYFTIKASE